MTQDLHMNMSYMIDLHKLLLDWRHCMGLSQGEIARRTQLDQSYISMIERGVVDIRLSTLERILEGFQLEAVEFLQGPQDNTEKESSSDEED